MALPGQSFKRVVVLVLDCGATMQQRIRGNPPIDNYAGEFETASSSVDSAASARTSSLSSASVSTTASSLHHAAPGVHSHRTHTAGNWDSETDEPVTSNTSAFAVMKRAALEYVQRLAATSARTDVGVVCFGGARTNNSLMDLGDQEGGADGGYRNVEEACKPEAASWKAVRAVEEAECSNAKSDAVDGIVVAVNMVEKQYGPKLAQNDVCFLLFSDCRATLADSDDVLPVLEHLNHLGIRVQLILVDGSFGCSTSTLRLPLQSSDESVCRQLPAFEPLAQLCTTLIPIKSFLASPAVRLFSPPLKRLSTKCRVNLTISSGFQIPVYVFVKVRKENLPTVRKRVFLGVQSAAGRTRIRSPSSASDSSDALQSPSKGETGDLLWRDLRVHRFYFRANDPDRNPVRLADQKSQAKFPWLSEHGEKSDNGGTPDVKGGRGESGESVQRLHAYRYGKQLVAVTSIEQEALKEKTVAGLVALGVARLDDIQRWWSLGPAEYVTCALNNRPSLMALRSLVVALDRLQSVLLCSFVWRSGNPAKLVALLPYIGSCPRRTTVTKAEQHHGVIAKETDEPRGADRRLVTYGLHLVYLPVAEDMLELRLPSLPSVTPAQLSAVETVVDKLVLPNPPPHVDHNCSLKSNLSSNHEDNKQAPRFAGLGSSLLEGQGLQATVQSPAGWQRNPALEVVAERAICIDSPSPPCSSRTFSSFLPDSIAAYGSASDFFDVRKICNPALQRYYHLLVYRHYRPAPRPPAAAGDGRGGEFQQTSEAEPPEVHRQILPRLWSRSSVGESLFGFEAERGASGKVVSGGLHTERPTDEDCDAALKAAYPLSTAPENQLTVRRQKEAQKKLLFGEVVRKQQQLQLHDIKVSGGDFDVEEDDRRGEQELRDNDAAQEEREREERITALKRLHVGSVNPIRDFRRLLEVKETDLTESAIQEMIDVIWRFLRSVSDVHGSAQESIENVRSQQLLRKAVACVETLREGCSKELEGGKFNEFLRELKAARSKGEYPRDAVSSLWDMLKRNGVGLITNVEDPGVGIQAAERLRVYDDDEHHSHTGSPQEEKARTTDPALADLLDLVE